MKHFKEEDQNLLDPLMDVIQQTPEGEEAISSLAVKTITDALEAGSGDIMTERTNATTLEISSILDSNKVTKYPQMIDSKNMRVEFNGKEMSLTDFFRLAKSNDEVKLLINELYKEFKLDIQQNKLKNNKGDKDFNNWLLAKYGGNAVGADLTVIERNNGTNMVLHDQDEGDLVEDNWKRLGYASDLDKDLAEFTKNSPKSVS